MTPEMTHEDVQAALAAEALDALDGQERRTLLDHLETCAECRRELAELREAAGALAHAAPYRPMEPARSDRVRARLLARARADREADGPADGDGGDVTLLRRPGAADDVTVLRPRATAPEDDVTILRPPPSASDPAAAREADVVPIDRARSARRGFGAGWLAAAASILLALALGAYALSLRGQMEEQTSRLALLEEDRASLRAAMGERDAMIDDLSNPDVRVIDMAAGTPQEPSGRMYWNASQGQWIFFAHHLQPLRPGRDYQLWVITPEGPRAADVFKVDSAGHAVVRMKHDIAPEQVRAVAVTEEPEGGLPKPSGTPFLVGTTGETE
jgi:anti-sigma-K factor RskA